MIGLLSSAVLHSGGSASRAVASARASVNRSRSPVLAAAPTSMAFIPLSHHDLATVDLQSFVEELQRGHPPHTGPVTHVRCPLSVKQGAEDIALSMGGTVVTRPNGATCVWSIPSGFHLKVSRSSAAWRNEVAFYRLAGNGSEHCTSMVWTVRLFFSISRRREDEAHLILTDTVCGLPCSAVQLTTARDLVFEETGWKHIDINVGNGFLDSSGQRAILIDFEDVIPPSSNGVTLSVDVSSEAWTMALFMNSHPSLPVP